MEEFNNYVFDMPKRPLNAFTLYVKDRIPDLRKENQDTPTQELIKIVGKEWKKEDGVSQSKYEKKAEQDKRRFIKQLKDFEKFGYYNKNSRGENPKKEDDDDEDEEEEKKSKRKSKKKRSTSTNSKSTKRTSKKSKSKSKTQESKRKSNSSKSRKKTAKTQKKNK